MTKTALLARTVAIAALLLLGSPLAQGDPSRPSLVYSPGLGPVAPGIAPAPSQQRYRFRPVQSAPPTYRPRPVSRSRAMAPAGYRPPARYRSIARQMPAPRWLPVATSGYPRPGWTAYHSPRWFPQPYQLPAPARWQSQRGIAVVPAAMAPAPQRYQWARYPESATPAPVPRYRLVDNRRMPRYSTSQLQLEGYRFRPWRGVQSQPVAISSPPPLRAATAYRFRPSPPTTGVVRYPGTVSHSRFAAQRTAGFATPYRFRPDSRFSTAPLALRPPAIAGERWPAYRPLAPAVRHMSVNSVARDLVWRPLERTGNWGNETDVAMNRGVSSREQGVETLTRGPGTFTR